MGFFISYLFFFVIPIFFSARVMQFFEYVPAIDPIGVDLRYMLSYSESWFVHQQTPYITNNLYPPLATVLFTPLLFMDFSLAYKLVTLATVLCYAVMAFVVPYWVGKEKPVSPSLMLVFITGLFSYGFQFELERGQFNVIAMSLCFLAIWIYHFHNRYRYLGYLLFSISVQLKVFPIIFIVMLISNWHDWRRNIRRMLILSALNFALFFILGLHTFNDFVLAITAQAVNPFVWVGNHSITSFVALGSYSSPGAVKLLMLTLVAVCMFSIMLQAWRQNRQGISPPLLLACAIGALLIPPVSHDYTLPILVAPVAILLSDGSAFQRAGGVRGHLLAVVLLLITSVAYSSTLFSYTNKPLLLQNNFLALLTTLLAITLLSLLVRPSLEGNVEENR
jgi:glycosyl transferase family 87